MFKTQIIYIIINTIINYNRKKTLWFSHHAAKDKNLSIEDLEWIRKTVLIGCIHGRKSFRTKICYKLYITECNQTYYVVARHLKDSIKIITAYKKKGKW